MLGDVTTGRVRAARAIEIASWSFVGLGAILPFAFWTAPFSMYRAALAETVGFGGNELLAQARMLSVVTGITGGSIAGKWVLHAAIARRGLSDGHRWAREATALGLGAWFVVDGAGSLLVGVWPNVVMINLLPVLLVGVPLAWTWPANVEPCTPLTDVRLDRVSKVVVATAVLGMASGLAIAFGGPTAIFEPWFHAFARAGFPTVGAERTLALAFFGPIGGCTVAQFALIAALARGPLRAGETWVLPWAIASILVWLAIDSAYGLALGATFNVVAVNVPAALLTVPPLAWAQRRLRTRQS
jgi:hypothetical protein